MKYEIFVCRQGHETNPNNHWKESYEDDSVTTDLEAREVGLAMVRKYNLTLRQGEHARTLISAHVLRESPIPTPESEWEKYRGYAYGNRRISPMQEKECAACFYAGMGTPSEMEAWLNKAIEDTKRAALSKMTIFEEDEEDDDDDE